MHSMDVISYSVKQKEQVLSSLKESISQSQTLLKLQHSNFKDKSVAHIEQFQQKNQDKEKNIQQQKSQINELQQKLQHIKRQIRLITDGEDFKKHQSRPLQQLQQISEFITLQQVQVNQYREQLKKTKDNYKDAQVSLKETKDQLAQFQEDNQRMKEKVAFLQDQLEKMKTEEQIRNKFNQLLTNQSEETKSINFGQYFQQGDSSESSDAVFNFEQFAKDAQIIMPTPELSPNVMIQQIQQKKQHADEQYKQMKADLEEKNANLEKVLSYFQKTVQQVRKHNCKTFMDNIFNKQTKLQINIQQLKDQNYVLSVQINQVQKEQQSIVKQIADLKKKIIYINQVYILKLTQQIDEFKQKYQIQVDEREKQIDVIEKTKSQLKKQTEDQSKIQTQQRSSNKSELEYLNSQKQQLEYIQQTYQLKMEQQQLQHAKKLTALKADFVKQKESMDNLSYSFVERLIQVQKSLILTLITRAGMLESLL